MRSEDILDWYDHVNISQASEIVCRYFLHTEASQDIPIAELLNNLPFRFNMANEEVEDATFISIELTRTLQRIK